jgi:diguanylate cyclase
MLESARQWRGLRHGYVHHVSRRIRIWHDGNMNKGMDQRAKINTPNIPEPSAADSGASPFSSAFELIFTRDPKQQLRIKRSLLATLLTTLCVILLFATVRLGFTKFEHAVVLTIWMYGCGLLAYLVIRSGLNRRFFADPALTLPQIIAAQISTAGSYAITGPVHMGVLSLLALILVFGMFNLSARNMRYAALLLLGLMGATISYKVISDPVVYDPKIEWLSFLMVVIIVPAISILAMQLTAIREKLTAQRDMLEARNRALDEAVVRIEHMAAHDALTGLFNRRRMLEVLREQQKLHARGGQRFCVVMIDLDLFKRINDAYGHNIGDEALRVFAREARHVMRETDVLARWGGEEFLFLLPNTPPGPSAPGLARLREALIAAKVCEDAGALYVTFSAGIVEYRAGESIESVIERADKALYVAKERGRDCTVTFEQIAAA